MAETVADVLEKLKDAEPVDLDKEGIERIVLPVLDFEAANGPRERVALRFAKPADRPAGDETMRSWSWPEDTAVLDGRFLVMLLRKGEEKPYFAMWVENSEVMLRAPTHFPYAEIGGVSEGLIRVSTVQSRGFFAFERPVGNCGFLDMKGNVVIPPQFADAGLFDRGVAPAAALRPDALKADEHGRRLQRAPDTISWGLIDREGKWVVTPRFGDLRNFHDDLAAAMEAPPIRKPDAAEGANEADAEPPDKPRLKWGFIDRKGQWVIPPQYAYAWDFCDGVARVETTDGKDLCIDKNGKAVEPAMDARRKLAEGLDVVEKDGRWWCVDDKGRQLFALPEGYELIETFVHGVAVIEAEGKIAAIDRTGRILVELAGGEIGDAVESAGVFVLARDDEPAVVVLPGGNIVRVPGFEKLEYVYEGVVLLRTVEGVGFMDRKGECIISRRFEEARPFVEGFAGVRLGKRWGYIDRAGQVVIPPRFDYVGCFFNGVAAVGIGETQVTESESRWGLIDKTGKLLTTAGGD